MRKFTLKITMVFITMMITLGAYSQHLMCVDRDGSAYSTSFSDVWPKFQGALDANHYTYTYFEVLEPELSGPDAAAMAEHDAVIFFTGETWTEGQTMSADDEFNLLLYLTVSGGKLFLSAQDYLWDRYPNAGVLGETEFPNSALGLEEVSQDVWSFATPDTMGVYGIAGSLAEGMVFGVQDVYSTEKEGLFIDQLLAHRGTDLFNMNLPGADSSAAFQYEGDNYKSVFSTLSFGAIIDTNVRTELMSKIVAWLLGTTGTVEITSKEKLDILLYPNPARDNLKIGMLEEMNDIKIFNNTGQLVYHKQADNNSVTVNVSSFRPGMYMVQARTENGIITERFLKE